MPRTSALAPIRISPSTGWETCSTNTLPFQVLKLSVNGSISALFSGNTVFPREYAMQLAGDAQGNAYMVLASASPPTGETFFVVKVFPDLTATTLLRGLSETRFTHIKITPWD